MTKLRGGRGRSPRAELVDLSDIVGSALAPRRRRCSADHTFTTDLEPDLPMVKLDPVLFEQVLFNLLDNAAKYAPRRNDDHDLSAARVGVSPSSSRCSMKATAYRRTNLERVFEKFYRVRGGDRQRAGSGSRARDLPRFRRGDGRHDHSRQIARDRQRRNVYHRVPRSSALRCASRSMRHDRASPQNPDCR